VNGAGVPYAAMQRWQRVNVDSDDRHAPEYRGDPHELVDAAALVMALRLRPAWHLDAACREHPELSWFPDRGVPLTAARQVCDKCLVRSECTTAGMREDYGVWGGLSIQQRVRLRRSAA
jgi:hypothetical protein